MINFRDLLGKELKNNGMKHVLALIAVWVMGFSLSAQEGIDLNYQDPQAYEIGGIEVEGAQYSDANALRSISGLKLGSTIRIPGAEIPRAIKRLYNLRLFNDVQFYVDRIEGQTIFLTLRIVERSRYSRHSFEGVKKQKHEDLNSAIESFLIKGSIVTENDKNNAKQAIKDYFKESGYLDAKVEVEEKIDENRENNVRLIFKIDQGEKVKIRRIRFFGNKEILEKKLRKKMKNTKMKRALLKKSVFLASDYQEDLDALIVFANNNGFRDARISGDSIWRDEDGLMNIDIFFEEGNRYYFGDIEWKGNTIYDDAALDRILGIQKGDIYNKELLDSRLTYNAVDGRDVSSLYLDNGYLFFRIDPIEKAIHGDTIDLEMRIFEGPQATIDRVEIKGNDKTHEHVIRRELRTKPSNKFSRSDIIRSQREIINLGYFNPESLGISTPVNAEKGTVDIIYELEEKSSDQLELSAGWGAGRIIGTIGVSFNNFSLRNFFTKEAWQPVPQGDGQRLSIRGQSNGDFFRSLNFSFTEPWLGGKKPTALNVAAFSTLNDFRPGNKDNPNRLKILRATVGISTRLRWPDDNFIFSSNVNFTTYQLDGWDRGLFLNSEGQPVTDGDFYNQSFLLRLARNSVNSPLFPTEGSLISLTSEFTMPHSKWFRNIDDYSDVSDDVKYRWLEYHKWRFDFDWYSTLVGKLVLKTSMKMGFVGAYDRTIGISPFERFILQKDPLQQGGNFSGVVGADIFILRGYEQNEIENEGKALPIINKVNMELRFPVSTNPQSTIYLLAFMEGAKTFNRFREFTPFDFQRSVGAGVRIFLPMFGLLGVDYGIGLDPVSGADVGIKTGTINFYLGFEPD